VRNALDFRRADGIVITSDPERVAVRLGERIVARTAERGIVETTEPISDETLALLTESGLPWRELFAVKDADTTAAS
jgi:hypothetical protein